MNSALPPQVDLTNCDREPIHQLGAIQPIGFMLVVSTDWLIARVSANIGEFFDVDPATLIGKPASTLLSHEAIHSLRNRLALLRGADAIERMFRCPLAENGRPYDIAVHSVGSQVIIEAEPSTEHHYGDATGTVRGMISRLEQATDLARFFNEGARQVRALTGFDRVMVYRFAGDGSGEVVAESAKGGIGSFMGLRYPATDIPRQARELYKRSLLRVITDIEAVPVPIVPTLDEHKQPLDLSLSVLRSVSPIHIEYLRNMGVRASMSISIVVDGELWGLIACHHYSPRCPSFERRSVAELFAQMFAMRIEARERQMTMEYERQARDISDQLLGAVASDESLLNDPDWLSDILTSAIPADGVGVWINGNYAFSGQTPDTPGFAQIVNALNGAAAGKTFATDQISSLVPDAERFSSRAAGMLAIPISRSPRDYVVLFRQEIIQSVRWAGNPQKPVEFGPNGPRLHPRQSFEEYKETVHGKSEKFTPSELRVAETLRATLIEVVLRLADEASVERQAASDRQELLIAELNHRVRNILSLIRGLVRQSKPPEGSSIEDFVATIDQRVHALARAHNQITDDQWGPAPLRSLIDAEVAAFLSDRQDRIETYGDQVLLRPQAYSTMALVIHELVTNSAKYGSLSENGRVEVRWNIDNSGALVIDWTEVGGPTVTEPTRRGFGTTIIQHSVPYDLGGTSDVDYAADGFTARFVIPGNHIVVSDDPEKHKEISLPHARSRTIAEKKTPDLLGGRKVLLVEDSLIIALDAEDVLTRLGAGEVLSEPTVPGAIVTIDKHKPDVAILDINLGDSNSFAIADRLDDLGIPFMFATGYGEQARLPDRHLARIVLQKPYTLATVARRLPDILEDAE
ncbi:HWE histidine kinase domain-containing protein [Sphingomonas sp. LY29]|uniref:HWE histidine kinase domain-containing protein n=1 Tax=Sphingomonas sp. LY29 TaxID=3095341 RepID=UPI002D7A33CF|nr:HWE histidine kinase domain-containing protein [Sphingomonas sp. LY29]WRP25709.1 HWE histidine kinase domain-containing protein [Sphingomonas sp. LY29]